MGHTTEEQRQYLQMSKPCMTCSVLGKACATMSKIYKSLSYSARQEYLKQVMQCKVCKALHKDEMFEFSNSGVDCDDNGADYHQQHL